MEYTTLGSTGMEVSKVCLGCMSFGSGQSGHRSRDWTLNEKESRKIIDRAIDLGINFFDTANTYGRGDSEEILGRALKGYNRDWTVVSTKVHRQMDDDNPNSGGLSRKAIQQEFEHSLDRLGMETVDLYHVHSADPKTPMEVTMRTLDDLVSSGRVRYPAASSMWTYQFMTGLHVAERLGLERFSVMQNHYSLAYREEERDMLPLCNREGIGVIPYSPLARGYLTRPHDQWHETIRGTDEAESYDHTFHEGGGREINRRVESLAEENDVSMAQISLAWLLHKEWVDAPIVGVSSVEHLEDAVESIDVDLSSNDMEYLEEPYEPSQVSGHS